MDPTLKIKQAMAELELRQRTRATRMASYQGDPVKYTADILGMSLTPEQEEILDSVRVNRRTAVKASHAVGKTIAASVAVNWWYDCWDQHIAYITASTWKQALELTFKQVKLLRRRKELPGTILETGWVRDEDLIRAAGHYIQAINCESGEGFQGEHTSPILIVMEEATGVPHYIHEAADGLMTHPDCRILEIANATDEATDFGAACSNPLFNTITISVLDHPNIEAELRAQPPPFPNAVRLLWLREMLEKECEVIPELAGEAFEFYTLDAIDAALSGQSVSPDSPRCSYKPNAVFQGRALGLFASQAAEQVIPRGWLDRLPRLEPPDELPEVGCDVARYGTDRTTIAARQGPCLLSVAEIRQMSLEAVTGAIRIAVREAAGPNRPLREKRIKIRIDVTGGLGAGPCDALAAEGYNVEGVNSSSSASDEENYPNRRSELWFDTRERARTRQLDLSRLPQDLRAKLVRELSTPKWKPNSKGKKVVEPKQETKKRLGASPDLADAVNLAYSPSPAEEGEPEAGGQRAGYSQAGLGFGRGGGIGFGGRGMKGAF
jgi:hypothetical protein